MRTILQCNAFSCLTMMTLIAVSLHFPANDSCAQHEVFDKNAIQKWKDYEVFSRNLQGTVIRTGTRLPDGKSSSVLMHYKQNRECALEIAPGPNPGEELIGLAHPRYIARIKRNASDPSNVVLVKYDPRPASETDAEIRAPFNGIFLVTSPHFSYSRSPLTQLVLKPSFKVTEVMAESHNGQKLIRVDHIYTYNVNESKNNQQERVRGSLYFDPSRCWCLRRYKNSVEVMFGGERKWDWEYEVEFETIDHPSGFPIVKSQTMHQVQFNPKSKSKIDITSRTDYTLEVKEGPPDSEFTLTAFGLPEPVDVEPVKTSIPLYVWILGAAGICGAIALTFRYLARRRSAASTA